MSSASAINTFPTGDQEEPCARYRRANPEHYGCLKTRAAAMRKNPTPAERAFWDMVRCCKLGVRFLRQYIIADYIVDFACLEKKIVVEIDGSYHLEDDQMEWDVERAHWLERRGFCVIRFSNNQILNTPDEVLTTLKEYIE